MSEIKPYKTSDLGLAAFLLCNDMTYLKPLPTGDGQRQTFVFIDKDGRDELVEVYMTHQQWTFSPWVYARAMKRLSQDIKRTRDGNR